MLNKYISSSLVLIISIFLSFTFVEYIAAYWIDKDSISSVCPDWNSSEFSNSRGYSLKHSYYEPLSTVSHCQPEYNYEYHIDMNGFRKHSFYSEHPKILTIGDSFTFGFGVKDDENFPALIGGFNAGMWGNPFDIQFNSFIRSVNIIHPNIVVWGIYPPHIISMMPGAWSNNIPGNKTLFATNTFFQRELLSKFPFQRFNNSSFVKLIYRLFDIEQIIFDGNNVLLNKNGYKTKEALLFDKNIYATEYTDSTIVNSSFGPDRDDILIKMQKYFKHAKRVADSKNIKILFTLIPSRLNLSLKDGSVILPDYQNASYDSSLPSNLISNAIIAAGFSKTNILDLGNLSEFNSGGWKKYYFRIDAHWNPDGHKLVAKSINNKLSEL